MSDLVLALRDLRVWFPVRSGLGDFFRRRKRTFVRAVDGVSFDLFGGDTLALVGESGSGKTTVARAIMGLLREAAGEIRFDGRDVLAAPRRERRRLRARMQMIFQDPFDAMNPRETVSKIVSEPLKIHRPRLSPQEAAEAAARALFDVGLSPPEDFMRRYPHEISGGQRQRVLIAGALILDPSLIIADEPVSMLDASLKVEILNLLVELRQNRALSFLMITHDLALTRYVADRIAIMYLGRIVETGPTRAVLAEPIHPYTRALISVVPTLDALGRPKRMLSGEIPHPSAIPAGCRFHPRCAEATRRCAQEEPATREAGQGRLVACHLIS